tara:strand:+ start:308 stop:874 length:567 start_codon:yes stop_codon:yes gene_type:complete
MHAYAIAKHNLISLSLLLLSLTAEGAEQISVFYAQITKTGPAYNLNATIHYPLSPRIIEAIDHGVPITFYQEFQLLEPFNMYWLWQQNKWSRTIHYQLRYHALSKQYILLSLVTLQRRSFPSLDTALDELGKIEDLNLPLNHHINGSNLTLQIRSGVDIHALPTPMRLGALVSDKWQIKSPWVNVTWP